jgi:aminoglycoside phosphotransferase
MLPYDVYTQPDVPDPVLDERTVLDLLRRHGVNGAAVTSLDETGGEARVYVIDGTLVLKVQRPHRQRPRTSLEKEAFFLRQLAAESEIAVPQVLGYGKEAHLEYLVMTRMSGVSALSVEITAMKRKALLHQLGRTLRRLHSIPQACFHDSALFPGSRTPDEFLARARDALEDAMQVIAANPHLWPLDTAPADLASRVLAAFPAAVDLVALHSNPGPVHTFVDPATLDFVGLIDFGDAYIGHPAFDWRWPTHEDHLAILQGYAAEAPLTDEFIAAWHAGLVLSDMRALATRPDRQSQALERLRHLLKTFT